MKNMKKTQKKELLEPIPPGTVEMEKVKAAYLGKLDEYFAMRMKGGGIVGDKKVIYELAVMAFINDISYNGLPKVRRARYNRELDASLAIFDLVGKIGECHS